MSAGGIRVRSNIASSSTSVAHAYRHHEGMKGDPERPEARASPGRLSPSSRDRPALHPGPKGGAEGAPNVPDKRGVLEGGACPPLHFSCQPPCLPAPRTMKGDRPPARRGE